ncbi:MAG TPA: transcriptional repressor [Thermoflexia bacterium]|jgi:Fe2+ or Zn2+ uptake regulation protein|nr:transcriptional repressor [Thermoflexia bacterium]
MAVVEALYTSSHPTAEEIHRQVSTRFPMVSLATVYKTLHVLAELGLARDLKVGERSRFDGNTQPHAHLVCIQCEQIADFPVDLECTLPFDEIEALGFRTLGYDLEIYGICRRCQAEERSSSIS